MKNDDNQLESHLTEGIRALLDELREGADDAATKNVLALSGAVHEGVLEVVKQCCTENLTDLGVVMRQVEENLNE